MEYIGYMRNDRILAENVQRPVIICGCGYFGQWVLDSIEKWKIPYTLVCFCDNDEKKQNGKVKGVEVVSVKEAVARFRDGIYLIMGKYDVQMARQLAGEKVEGIHFLLGI